MVTPQVFLQELGLSSKEIQVYLTLLRRGPSSVRELSSASDINRGTTYDVLKSLQEQGVVSFFDKQKKTYFAAEDPESLRAMVEDKKKAADSLQKQLTDVLPQLSSLAAQATTNRPVARYYHGPKAIRSILLEVLQDVGGMEKKEYFVYSSSAIAKHLYDAIPNFTKKRIQASIHVKVIAFGKGGNGDEEYAERKCLTKDVVTPTYTIIFGNKTAFISLDDHHQPHGVIMEDVNLAETQRMLFHSLWDCIS